MTVKIVTDSVADLPSEVVEELGIAVVPLNVRFGTEVYRDGIDLTAEQFYDKLKYSESYQLPQCQRQRPSLRRMISWPRRQTKSCLLFLLPSSVVPMRWRYKASA